MRLALPFLLLCCALVAATLVLGWASHAPDLGPLPDLTLRDPAGQRFELSSLRGRVWVASFVSADCLGRCESVVERLAGLHDGLPRGVPLVTFVVDGRGQWPSAPAGAHERADWIICQGNSTDADPEAAVTSLATERLRVEPALVAGLSRAEPAAIIVAVDAHGRTRRVDSLAELSTERTDPGVAAAWGEAEFLTELHGHPLRDAALYGVVVALLCAGVVCARMGWVRVHPFCTVAGAVLTIALVGSTFHYVDAAASVPFHGTGWRRPLYLAVLGTHGAIGAAMVVAGLTLVYLALRDQLARHRASARWIAPAWIATAVTGSIVHFLLYLWFGTA